MDTITVFSHILGVYSLIMLAFGTLFNIVTVIVCVQKRLRSVPTFVFMSFLVITDTIALYFWNIDNYLSTFHGYMMEYVSIHTCKLTTFMQMFSLQSSAWLLLAMSFERYLSVQFRNWRTTYFNSKKAAIVSTAIVTFIFFMNFHVIFTIDFSNLKNVTSPAICFYSDGFVTWRKAHTYLYSIIPFILLVIVNVLLIARTVQSEKSITRSKQEIAKRRNMSMSVIIMTMSFILLTIFNAIAGGYYLGILVQTSLGTLILFIGDSLLFTYHSFNFIVLMVSNKKFNSEVRDLVSIMRHRHRIHQDSTIATNGIQTNTKNNNNNNKTQHTHHTNM